jgi:hypothetical protein
LWSYGDSVFNVGGDLTLLPAKRVKTRSALSVDVVTLGRNVSAPPGYDAVLDYLGLTRINVRKDIGLSDLGLIIIATKNLNSCIKEVNSEWSYFNDMTNKQGGVKRGASN